METAPIESQTEAQSPAKEKTDWKRFTLDVLETVGLAVVLFLIINLLSARVRVDGFSMVPTLQDSEFVLVNRLAYHIGSPTRGDIIVFQSVNEKNLDLIKRVIGLPGDHIAIGNGNVVVDGLTLSEPYIAAAPDYHGEWDVPQLRLLLKTTLSRGAKIESYEMKMAMLVILVLFRPQGLLGRG